MTRFVDSDWEAIFCKEKYSKTGNKMSVLGFTGQNIYNIDIIITTFTLFNIQILNLLYFSNRCSKLNVKYPTQ